MFYYAVMILVLAFVLRVLALLSVQWQKAKAKIKALPDKWIVPEKFTSLIDAYKELERKHALLDTPEFLHSALIFLQTQALSSDAYSPHPLRALLHDALYQYVFWHRVEDHAAIQQKPDFDNLPPLLIKMIKLQTIAVALLRKKDVNLLKAWLLALPQEEKILINWKLADFSALDLRAVDFSYGIYLNANFFECRLDGANLEHAYFNELKFQGASLLNINWEKVVLNVGYNFNLQGATIDEGAYRAFKNQSLTYFSNVIFKGDFKDHDFSRDTLSHSRFEEGQLINPNFSGAIMPRIYFQSAPQHPNFTNVQVSSSKTMRKIEKRILKQLSKETVSIGVITALHEYHHILALFSHEGIEPEQLAPEHWRDKLKLIDLPHLRWALSSEVKWVLKKVTAKFPFFCSQGDSLYTKPKEHLASTSTAVIPAKAGTQP